MKQENIGFKKSENISFPRVKKFKKQIQCCYRSNSKRSLYQIGIKYSIVLRWYIDSENLTITVLYKYMI